MFILTKFMYSIMKKRFNIENVAGFQPQFTRTRSNTKIPTLYARYHAQTIFKGFAKVRKSEKFEIFALLLYKNGLMKQDF